MYIRLSKSDTAKKTKVYLVEGYRDENGKVRQRIVKKYGNLEDLQAKDPNILEKLRAQAKEMPKNEVKLTLNLSDTNSKKKTDKNYGYFFLEKIYNDLKITEFLRGYSFQENFRYDLDQILRLLVFSRILKPESKLKTFESRNDFFSPFKCTLNSIYRSLAKMDEIKDDLQAHLNSTVSKVYGRDASLVFYDVTNYYFETEIEDDLRRKGMSKDNKRSPIVQMGLLIDRNGLPIAYKLFPGNTNDVSTLEPFLSEVKERYKLGRIILTADKGLNSGNNLSLLLSNQDGYIVSQKIRGASKTFVEEVLNEEGYVYNNSKTFKLKSFIRERKINNEVVKEKCVCFWSETHDEREKKKRIKLEEKLSEFLENPAKYKASNRYGLKKYLKLQTVNKGTGEINEIEPFLEFEKDKYFRDRSLDGYYVIVTSELDMLNEDIIEKYRGLWKIEESFKVIKSDLEGRPVFVRRNDHIQGHFLVCFIALLISRIVEMRLDYKHSIKSIQDSLLKASCRHVDRSIYSLNKQDNVFRDIEKAYNVSLDFKHVRIEQLRAYKRELIHNTPK